MLHATRAELKIVQDNARREVTQPIGEKGIRDQERRVNYLKKITGQWIKPGM